jgi:hypothetical protein
MNSKTSLFLAAVLGAISLLSGCSAQTDIRSDTEAVPTLETRPMEPQMMEPPNACKAAADIYNANGYACTPHFCGFNNCYPQIWYTCSGQGASWDLRVSSDGNNCTGHES